MGGEEGGPKAGFPGPADPGKAPAVLDGSGLDLLLAAGDKEAGGAGGARGGGGGGAHAGGSSTPAASRPSSGWEDGGGGSSADLDPSTGLPQWARDMRFSSDMLDGSQVSYILHNVDRLRQHVLSTDSTSEQFCTYDRHPPATALEPQSGVVYLIRTQEGLQDKAISLKSVATGPSNFVWKMAWGRKTHLKSSGVLYKSYRCRYLYRPKNSPPPFRMQIYVLEEHDIETSKGEAPTPGLALIHILSVQDAPPRHWPSCRASKRRGKPLEPPTEAKRSPRSAAKPPPPLEVHAVPATPYVAGGAGASPPSGSEEGGGSAKASKVNTKLEDLYSPARANAFTEPASVPQGSAAGGRLAGGRQAAPAPAAGAAGGAGRPQVQRLQAPPAVGGKPRGVGRACKSRPPPPRAPKRHQMAIACDPIEGLGGACGEGVGRAMVEGTQMMQKVARGSFPEQAEGLAREYGGLSGAVLAGFVTGTPWGIPGVGEWAGGAHVPDYTALGWAKLLSAWEQEHAKEYAGAAAGRRGVKVAATRG